MRGTIVAAVMACGVLGGFSLVDQVPTVQPVVQASGYSGGSGMIGEGTLGDLDKDGEVSSTDALLILQFDAAVIDPPPHPEKWYQNGDLNEDGLLDSLDAVLILQFHAGLLESL